MQIPHFVLNVVCAYLSCVSLSENPSDPLAPVRNETTRGGKALKLNPIVYTKNGGLEGYFMRTIRQREIFAFEGIPYAENMGGSNRFKAPIPKKSWKGLRLAKRAGHACVQFHLINFHIEGNEDCLTLNIYTPKLPTLGAAHPNLPILLWIHGGSYFFGSGSEYGPAYLLEKDVILVTINFRLGPLGFLSTLDEVIPGNNGLKDQALAMKWVYDNIYSFGGDPSRITIAGQSSGAANVHQHMISHSSRKYFSRAISLSGTAFNPWSIGNTKYTKDLLARFDKQTSCSSKNSTAFLHCLRRIDPYLLIARSIHVYQLPATSVAPFAPVIENEDIPGAFLTKTPDQAYAEGDVARVPWLCTRTADEGHFPLLIISGFHIERPLTPFLNNASTTILHLDHTSQNPKQDLDKIFKYYLGNKKISLFTNYAALGDLWTDRHFGYGVHKSLQAHSGIAPTYSYRFGYKGNHGLPEYLGLRKERFGVGHISDLPLIFNMSNFFPGFKTTDVEFRVVKLMTSMVANFAKYGEPLYTDQNRENIRIWEPVTDPENIHVLDITNEVKMIKEPHKNRLKFWESLGLEDSKPWHRPK